MMSGRPTILALLLGVLASVGFGPIVTAPAHAATYCNVYPPTRIAVWRPVDSVTIHFGEGCLRSGSSGAAWTAQYLQVPADFGTVAYESTPLASLYDRLVFTDEVSVQLTEVRWTPVRNDETSQLQNSPFSTIKLGSVSYVSAARFGGYHEVIARSYHYSPSAERIVPSGHRPGQVQFRTPGSPVWKPVAGVRLDGTGQAVVRTWSPGPRYYRVSFGEQPTIFDTISSQVRAR